MERDDIYWQYVPTRDDPADLGSRGSLLTKIPEIWWESTFWLHVKGNWPRQPDIQPSEESEREIKISKGHKSIVFTTVGIQDDFNLILNKFDLSKALRTSTWILRFINNCRKNKKSGPLTTGELVNQKKFYIKGKQEKVVSSDRFQDGKNRLNLEKNYEGVYIGKGRLQVFYPIYLPQDSVLSKKVFFAEHKRSLHGGVAMAMLLVISLFWILHLRRFSKSVIRNCYGCKKFGSLSYHSTKPGQLPKDRTEKFFPFKVIGTDYVGPIYYKIKEKNELKTYILLFSCSVTRAVHLELVFNLTTTEFIKGFKRQISRRGKPKIVHSDNSKSFKAVAKWLANINRDQKLYDFLSSETILWKFNTPEAPWCGGHFERLIGLIKACLYRTTGKAQLTWAELGEV